MSVKESKRLENFISSAEKRFIREQNSDPHSTVSIRVVESSNPSWSTVPGSVDCSGPISESIPIKRRKRKNKSYKSHDCIRKHIDDSLGVTHLETPSKGRKLVKKQLTFSTGSE